MLLHALREWDACRRLVARRAYAPAARIGAGQRLAGGLILQGLEQKPADLGDRGVADAEMLERAVGDRPHRFLNRAVLDAKSLHAGERLSARLQFAIDQVVVVLVLDGAVGADDVLGVDAEMRL